MMIDMFDAKHFSFQTVQTKCNQIGKIIWVHSIVLKSMFEISFSFSIWNEWRSEQVEAKCVKLWKWQKQKQKKCKKAIIRLMCTIEAFFLFIDSNAFDKYIQVQCALRQSSAALLDNSSCRIAVFSNAVFLFLFRRLLRQHSALAAVYIECMNMPFAHIWITTFRFIINVWDGNGFRILRLGNFRINRDNKYVLAHEWMDEWVLCVL